METKGLTCPAPAPESLAELVRLARRLGASDAAVIEAGAIPVKDELADRCQEPRCENYGRSPSCPPHVAGPSAFRQWQAQRQYAIVLKIDVPSRVLFSHERREVMQLLHEIAAGVERAAARSGFPGSRAFAGGSCKNLFCEEHRDCRVLAGDGTCRNPRLARPSMSGFGIHVSRLMDLAGWPADTASRTSEVHGERMSHVTALVLLGPPAPARDPVRPSTLADWSGWLDLAKEVEPLFGPMRDDPAFRDALRHAIMEGRALCVPRPGGPCSGALTGGIVIAPDANEIAWFAVTRTSRGQGIGKALLAEALARLCPERPVTVTTFAAGVEAGRPARVLYRRFGFRDHAPGGLNPAGIETVVMHRPCDLVS